VAKMAAKFNEGHRIQLEGHKLMYHVDEVSRWLKGETVAPIYVEIGPINACNHKCVFCALDYIKSKGAMIDKKAMINTLKNMADFGVKSIMFAGEGEPLAYPFIAEAVDKAKEYGLDIAITTNGVLLDEKKAESILENISWIKFSIDAGTRETYAKVHRCSPDDFDKVMKNIKSACEHRKKNGLKCAIGCQILLIPSNINEVEKLILKVKELGVDYLVLKPYSQHPNSINKLVLDLKKNDNDSKLTGLSKKHSTAHFKVIYRNISAQEVERKQCDYDKCHGLNFFALVDASGNIIPCNLFYEKPEYYYGNINRNTFEEIWNSRKRKEILEKLYGKGCENCRKGCRLNFVNKYLDAVKNRNIEHINFI
ncbi:MAG: radical SAM protein, partial [Candidatus Woesearchaeota archaeon]|nr:radical SAM protein [Candidatus Woesearchaeota archaeon]